MITVNDLMLIFNLVMVGIVVFFALWGLFAGFKREIKCFIALLAILVLGWVLFGSQKFALDTALPSFVTSQLGNILENMFKNFELAASDNTLREIALAVLHAVVPNGEQVFVEGTEAYQLAMNLVGSIGRMIVLLGVTVLILFVIAPILRFITFIIGLFLSGRKGKAAEAQSASTKQNANVVVKDVNGTIVTEPVVTGKKDNAQTSGKSRKMRLAGAGIGALRGLLVVLLICTPLTGIFSVVEKIDSRTLDLVNQLSADENGDKRLNLAAQSDGFDLEYLLELAKAYDKSFMRRIAGAPGYVAGKPLDEALFDSWTKIKTDNTTVHLREEVDVFVKIINAVGTQIDDGKLDVFSLDESALDTIEEQLPKSKILQALLPAGIEFVLKQNNLAGIDIAGIIDERDIDVSALYEIDWDNDLPKLVKAARAGLELGDFSKLNPADLDSETLRTIVSELGSTEFVGEVLPVVINIALAYDKVEDLLGGSIEKLDLDAINWGAELNNLVDIYDLFKTLGVEDFNNLDLVALVKDVVNDETKFDNVKELVTKLADSELFKTIVPPIGDVVLNAKLPEQFRNIISLSEVNPDYFKDDFLTLLDIAKDAVKLGALESNIMDSLNISDVSTLKSIVEKIFTLHITEGKMTDLLLAVIKPEILDLSDVDLSDVNWNEEKDVILELLDVYGEFITIDGVDATSINTLMKTNFMNLFNQDATIDRIIDVLEVGLDSKLFKHLVPEAFEQKLVEEILKKQGLDGIFTEGDYADYAGLVDKIKYVMEIVRDLSELGAFGDEGIKGIDWSKTDVLRDIVTRFFNSEFVNGRETRLVKIFIGYFDKKDKINLDNIDFDAIDWASEQQRLLDVIDMLEPILKKPGLQLPDDYKDLINTEDLGRLVDAFELFAESDLLKQFTPEIVRAFMLEKLPGDYREFADLTKLDKALLEEDLYAIAAILRDALDLHLEQAYNGNQNAISLLDLEPLKDIVIRLFGLNMLDGKQSRLLQTVLKVQLQLDTEGIDFEKIEAEWDNEVDIIVNIISKLEVIRDMEGIELKEYGDLERLLKDLQTAPLSVISTEVGYQFADIIDLVLDSNIFQEILHNAYEKFVYEKVDASLKDVANLDNIDTGIIVSDLQLLVDLLRDVLDFGIIDIANGGDIEYGNVFLIQNMIKKLFSLNLLTIKKQQIINYLDEKLPDVDLTSINSYNIDFAADGQLLADAYEKLAVLFSNSNFPYKNKNAAFTLSMEVLSGYLKDAYEDENMVGSVLDGLRAITNLTILKEGLPVAFAYAKDKLGEKFDFGFVLDVEGKTNTALVDDLKSLIEVVQDAVDLGVLTYLNVRDVNLQNLEPLRDIVTRLFDLNILDGKLQEVLAVALEKVYINTSDVDVDAINFDDERDLLISLITKIEEIRDMEGINVVSLGDLLSLLDTVKADPMGFVTTEKAQAFVDALHILDDSQILEQSLREVYRVFVYPMLKDTFGDLVDPENISNDEMVEDVRSLVVILDNAVKFGAVDIVKGEEVHYERVEEVTTIIKKLFGLNILDAKKVEILSYVDSLLKTIDLSGIEASDLDLENDGLLLASAYVQLADILTDAAFPIKSLRPFTINLPSLMAAYLYEDRLNQVLDALRYISGTTLVREVLPLGLTYAQSILEKNPTLAEYAGLIDPEGLTDTELATDLQSLIEVAQDALDVGALDYYKEGDMSLQNLEPVADALKRLLSLNLLEGRYDDALSKVLYKLGLVTSNIDFEAIDFGHDRDLLVELISKLETFRDTDGVNITTVKDALELMNAVVKDPLGFINNNKAYQVVDILDLLLDSHILRESFKEVYTALVYPMLEVNYGDLADLDQLTKEEILADLDNVVVLLRAALDFGIVDVIDGADIHYRKVAEVQTVIETLFGLNFLNAKKAEIIDLADRLIPSVVLDVDAAALDLRADGQLLKTAYAKLAVVLGDPAFPIKNIHELKLDQKAMLDAYLNEDVLNEAIDGLRDLSKTTLLKEVLPLGLDFSEGLLKDYALFVKADGLTKDQLAQDVQSLVAVLQDAVDAGFVDLYTERNMNLQDLQPVKDIIRRLMSMNLLEGKYDDALEIGLKYLVDPETLDLSGIDFAAERELLINLVTEIEQLRDTEGIEVVSLDSALSLVKEFQADWLGNLNKEMADEVVDILDLLADSQIIKATFQEVYRQKVYPSLEPKFGELADISGLNQDEVQADLNGVVAALRAAVDFGLVDILKGENIDYTNVNAARSFIQNIFGLNIITDRLEEIVKYIAKFAPDLDLSEIDYTQINLKADGEVLANIYEALADVLSDGNFPIRNLRQPTVDFKALYETYAKNRDYANDLVSALRLLTQTTLLHEMLPGLVHFAYKYVDTVYGSDYSQFLVTQFIDKNELTSDAQILVEMAQQAVDQGITDYLRTQDMEISDLTPLKNLINMLFNLNILKGRYDDIMILALKQVNINEDFYNQLGIDWDAERASLTDIIDKIEVLFNTDGIDINYLSDAKDFILNIKDDYKLLMTNEIFTNVGEIGLDIAQSPLLIGASYFAFYSFVYPTLPENYQPLFSFEEIGIDKIVSDFEAIVGIINRIRDLGIEDIYAGEPFPYEDVDTVEYVITKLFNLNYLNLKKAALFDFAQAMLEQQKINLDLSKIDINRVDFSADAQVLVDIYQELLPVLTDESFPFKDLLSFYEIPDLNTLINDFANQETINQVLEALRLLLNTTLVNATVSTLADIGVVMLPGEYQELADVSNLTSGQIMDDLRDLVEVLQLANDFNATTLVTEEHDLTISDLTLVKEMLTKVYGMNIVREKYGDAIELALEKMFVDVTDIDFSGINLDTELQAMRNVVDKIQQLLDAEGIATMSDLLGFVKEFTADPLNELTNARLVNLADVLEALLASDTLKEVLPATYERYAYEGLLATNEDLAELLRLNQLTREQLVDDLNKVAAAMKDAAELDVLGKYKAVTENLKGVNTADVQAVLKALEPLKITFSSLDTLKSLLDNVLSLNALDLKAQDLLDQFDPNHLLGELNLGTVDFARDADVIAEIIGILQQMEDLEDVSIVRPTLLILQNEEFFRLASTAYAKVLSLGLFENAVVPYLEKNILPLLASKNITLLDKFTALDGDQLIGFFYDVQVAFNRAIDMGLFNVNGVNLRDDSNLRFIYGILSKYLNLDAKTQDLAEKVIQATRVFGTLSINYEGVVLADEKAIIQAIYSDIAKILTEQKNGTNIFSPYIVQDEYVMDLVRDIIAQLAASKIYPQILEPALNRLAVNGLQDNNFELLAAVEPGEWTEAFDDVIGILSHILDFGLENILRKDYAALDFSDMSDLTAIIDILANSKLIQGREAEIFSIIIDSLTKVSSSNVDLSGVDWALEWSNFKAIINKLGESLSVSGITLDSLLAANGINDALDNADFANKLFDALDLLGDSQILKQSIVDFASIYKLKGFGEFYDAVELGRLTNEELAADYKVLIDIARILVVDFKVTGEIDMKNLEPARQTINLVFTLNMFNGREAEIFTQLLAKIKLSTFTVDTAAIDLSSVDWTTEEDALINLITAVETFANVEGVDIKNLNADTFKNQAALDALVDVLKKLSLSGLGVEILPQFFDYALTSFDLPYLSDLTIDYETVDWVNEMNQLATIVTVAKDFGGITSADFATNVAHSTDATKIAALLHAVNNSDMLRPMLPDMIHEALVIADLTSWETEWFTNQTGETGVMASKEEWEPEIDNLAQMIAEAADFNVNTFNLENATDADIDTVGRILNLMNDSRIFNINNITSILEITDTNSVLYGSDFSNLPATHEAWHVEIATLVTALKQFNLARPIGMDKYQQIGDVLNTMKTSVIISPNFHLIIENATKQLDANFSQYVDLDTVDLLSIDWYAELTALNSVYTAFGGDQTGSSFTDIASRIANSTDSLAIADLLRNVNNSELLRQMLPQMIHEALVSANLTDWEKPWFTAQLGETGVMAPKAEWDAEIDNLAQMIAENATFDVNTFNMETATDAEIDSIGRILTLMNDSRIFDINNLTSILAVTDTTSVLFGSDFSTLPATHEEWTTEIGVLTTALKQFKAAKPIVMANYDKIGLVLNTMENSIIFRPNFDLIIENATEQLDANFSQYVDLDTVELTSINWLAELSALNNVYNAFTGTTATTLTQMADLIATSNDATAIGNLLGNVNHATLLRQMLPQMVHEALVAANLTDWEKDWFTAQVGETGIIAPAEEWDAEIPNLASLIAENADYDITTFDVVTSSDAEIDTIGTILNLITDSRILDINNVTSVLEINDTNSPLYGTEYNTLPNDNTSWHNEIGQLVIALHNYKAAMPMTMDKYAEIGNMLEAMKTSVLFGSNLKLIINNSLTDVDGAFAQYIDLDKFDVLGVFWPYEMNTLNSLYSDFNNLNDPDYSISTMIGTNITNLMNLAATAEVASQIFGHLINNQLADLLDSQNPVDGLGNPVYDYTNKVVLGANAANVGKLVDFGNEVKALFENNTDAAQGLVVGNWIMSYAVAPEETRPTFADTYFPAILTYANNRVDVLGELDMRTVDYGTEGQLFINFYAATTDEAKLAATEAINADSHLTKAILASMSL